MKIKQLKGEIQYPKREKERVDKLTWQKREMKGKKKEKKSYQKYTCALFFTRSILLKKF